MNLENLMKLLAEKMGRPGAYVPTDSPQALHDAAKINGSTWNAMINPGMYADQGAAAPMSAPARPISPLDPNQRPGVPDEALPASMVDEREDLGGEGWGADIRRYFMGR